MAKILIADDEPDIVELIKRYAFREGYEVKSVEDGAQAVEICKNEDFDIIIMDIMMPDIDGFTASKKIREKKIFRFLCCLQEGRNMISCSVLNREQMTM